MVFLAAAALAATPPSPPRPVAVIAQATATIRVVYAVRLKLDGAASNPVAPPPRESVVKASDGSVQSAKLIEFQ